MIRYIEAYSSLLSYIHTHWGILKVYSGIFSTLCNHRIFTTLPYSEHWHLGPEAYSNLCETLTRYIQKSASVKTVYSVITQPHSGVFATLCNACICRPLEYSESWNIQNPSVNCIPMHNQNPVIVTKIGKPWETLKIQNPDILRILEHSEPWHIHTRYIFRTLSKI